MNWRFWKQEPEKRAADYTSLLSGIYEAAAHTGIADATRTAAVEAAAGALSRAFSSATVEGPSWARRAVNARTLGQIGRDLILSGSSTHVIEVNSRGEVLLLPATNIAFQSGGPSPTSWLAVCTNERAGREYHQVGPLGWPGLDYLGDFPATALCGRRADQLRLHHGQAAGRNGAISKGMSRVDRLPQILPIPRNDAADPDADPGEDTADPLAGLRSDIKKARGRALLTETVAAGWGEGKASAPQADWTARRLGPAPPEAMVQLRRQSFDAVFIELWCTPLNVYGWGRNRPEGSPPQMAYERLPATGEDPGAGTERETGGRYRDPA